MPPRVTIEREDILHAAVELVRERGMEAVNARSLAEALSCSTKPLFRVYRSMDELKKDVQARLDAYYNTFMEARMSDENRLLTQSVAYIEFARTEKNIFGALFMDRTMAGASLSDIVHAPWNRRSILNAQKVTGLPMARAERLFIDVWLYSHGVAAQIAANDIDLPEQAVADIMAEAFRRFSA